MSNILFDLPAFRQQFTAFNKIGEFPDITLNAYWDNATAYVTNQRGGCFTGALTLAQQTLALNLMTAHLAALGAIIGKGETPGVLQGATIDKISVTMQPPPEVNQWQWWLNLTPYGQQLLALLQVRSAGGFYVPGPGLGIQGFRGIGWGGGGRRF